MKKFLATVLGCAVLSLTLCACSGGGNVGTYDNNGTNGYYDNNTKNNTLNSSNNTNNTKNNNNPGIGGGVSGSISGGVSMNNIWDEINAELGENIPSAQEASEKNLSDIYGLDIEDLDEYNCYISDDENKPDEIFIAKVKTGKMSDVEAAVRNRQRVLEEKWKDDAKDEKGKVSKYKLITNGNYLIYVVSDKADNISDIFNKYTKDEKVTK